MSYSRSAERTLRVPYYLTDYVVLAAIVGLSVGLFGYAHTMSEPDMVRMMMALVYGSSTGEHMAAGHHYGDAFSFGYYGIIYALFSDRFLKNPDDVALLINYIGAVAGVFCATSCLAYFRLVLGRVRGLFVTIAFLGCPVMLPLLISGHPIVLASAFMFLGASLLRLSFQTGYPVQRATLLVAAFAALLLGLTIRAELILAYPFLAMMALPVVPDTFRQFVVRIAPVIIFLALTFLAFLGVRHFSLTLPPTRSVGEFLDEFISITKIGKGVAALILATGPFALVGLVYCLFLMNRMSLIQPYLVLACAALCAPTLVFWLANPLPARHFMFAALAAYVFLAEQLGNRLKTPIVAASLALIIVLANQATMEAVRPLLVRSYAWHYASLTGRRATQGAAIGAFPLDQISNRDKENLYRDEAVALARSHPDRLIIMADSSNYLTAYLIASGKGFQLRDGKIGRFNAVGMTDGRQTFYVVERYKYWPSDVIGEVLAMKEFQDWPIYVQPMTRTAYDKVEVPADRAFLPTPAGSD